MGPTQSQNNLWMTQYPHVGIGSTTWHSRNRKSLYNTKIYINILINHDHSAESYLTYQEM